MGVVHCPLCGLRFQRATELDQHALDDHAPPPPPETRDSIKVPRPHVKETALDQVLAHRAAQTRPTQ